MRVLFERIRDEGEDFLILVEQQHDPEVPQSFIREPDDHLSVSRGAEREERQ